MNQNIKYIVTRDDRKNDSYDDFQSAFDRILKISLLLKNDYIFYLNKINNGESYTIITLTKKDGIQFTKELIDLL